MSGTSLFHFPLTMNQCRWVPKGKEQTWWCQRCSQGGRASWAPWWMGWECPPWSQSCQRLSREGYWHLCLSHIVMDHSLARPRNGSFIKFEGIVPPFYYFSQLECLLSLNLSIFLANTKYFGIYCNLTAAGKYEIMQGGKLDFGGFLLHIEYFIIYLLRWFPLWTFKCNLICF